MAALDLNSLTPAEVDICNSTEFVLYLNNSGPEASGISINVTLPGGFQYDTGTSAVTTPDGTFSQEPDTFGNYLNWTNSSWVLGDEEDLKIEFNLTAGCGASSGYRLETDVTYSGGSESMYSPSIIVNQGLLKVTKEPRIQSLGNVSWTIYIDNNGNETAENVSIVDILGDGFSGIDPANGTITSDQPYDDWTTITWMDQQVPVGVGTWSVVVSAFADDVCGLTHTNNVTVQGTCDIGCVYSNDSDIAYAWTLAVFRLESLETLLLGQTNLMSSFEFLLENTTLDAEASVEFLNSFDDLSERQQLALEGLGGLVQCNWNDLDIDQRIELTSSMEDLLRRQAEIISSNELLLRRGYCELDETEKASLLARFEDRLLEEQNLLVRFNQSVYLQEYLNEADRETWYQFLASYEDLIWRQANLIADFQTLLYFNCEGTFLTVVKEANLTEVDAGDPLNYTFVVNNTGTMNIENITINDSILGVIQASPGITLAPGQNHTYFEIVGHNCDYCSDCICRICNVALACGDLVLDEVNRTHICVVSNGVCVNVSQPGPAPIPVYPG